MLSFLTLAAMCHTLFVLVTFVLMTLFSYHNHCIPQITEQFRLEAAPGSYLVQSPTPSKVNSEYLKMTFKKEEKLI